MGKRFENIMLNGCHFIKDNNGGKMPKVGNATIYDAYKNPSTAKRYIWGDWVKWAKENNGHISVSGANCMKFSIVGYVTDSVNGNLYGIFITKENNRCWEITE